MHWILELSLWSALICIHYFVFIDFFINPYREEFYILDAQVSSKCCKIDILNSKWRLRRFFRGKKLVQWSVHLSGTNIPNRSSRRAIAGEAIVPLTSRRRLFSRASWGFSRQTFFPNGRTADMIGRFRCDARLIREAVEIDFRVGGRLVETSKDSRLPSPLDILWPPQTLPFI